MILRYSNATSGFYGKLLTNNKRCHNDKFENIYIVATHVTIVTSVTEPQAYYVFVDLYFNSKYVCGLDCLALNFIVIEK